MAWSPCAVKRHPYSWVSDLKLASLGIEIDELTPEQRAYLTSWRS
jgi:S-adenosylhomocysteine hydrolase